MTARQIQMVVWDDRGAAVWSTAVALPTTPPTAEEAYEIAMRVANLTELMVLELAGQPARIIASEIGAPVLRAKALI